MSDVFISYSKRVDLARDLGAALKAKGIEAWWDVELYAGQRFNDAIISEIERATAVIVIWTKESIESKYVWMEVGMALSCGKLVPVYEDLQNPLPLKSCYQACSVTDIPAIVRGLEELVPPLDQRIVSKLNTLDRGDNDGVTGLGELLAQLPKQLEPDFYLQYHASFSTTVRSSINGKDINLGTIGRDGRLYMSDFWLSSRKFNAANVANDYLNGLVRILPTAKVVPAGNSFTLKVGNDFPHARPLLERPKEWKKLLSAVNSGLGGQVE